MLTNQLVTDYIHKHLPLQKRKSGREEVFECPSCLKPKLHVNRSKGIWYCFREGKGGRIDGPPKTLDPPIKILRQLHDLSLPDFDEVKLTWAPASEAPGLLAELIREYLSNRQITLRQLERFCFLSSDPKYWGRVMMTSPNGYWVAKKVLGDGPNYLNPSGPKRPWITWFDNEYVIVEGVFDALAVERAGFTACAILGSTLSNDMINFLESAYKLTLLLDKDTALKTFRLLDEVKFLVKDVRTILFEHAFPGFKDPAEVPTAMLKQVLANANI